MELLRKEIELDKSGMTSIFFLSDLHEGSTNFDKKSLEESVSFILNNSNKTPTHVFLMGDLVDIIVPSDIKRFNPSEIDEEYSLRDLKNLAGLQAEKIAKKLSPIKHLLLGAIIGNHEEAYIKRHNFDVYDAYTQILGCQKLGYVGIAKLLLRNQHNIKSSYTIGMNHGYGAGGSLAGSAIRNCKRFFSENFLGVDLGVMGHYHKIEQLTDLKEKVNCSCTCMVKHAEHYITCGSYLMKTRIGTRGYAEHYPKNSDVGLVYVDLHLRRHQKYEGAHIKTDIKKLIF